MKDLKANLNILIIADCHSLTPEEVQKLQHLKYDVCFLLGDINDQYLKMILKYIPRDKIYGVLGNHDQYGLLEENDITNIHLKTIEIDGVTFLGYEGSHRYKKGDFVMHTQEECIEALDDQPGVDILISHEGPHALYNAGAAHCGFKGITDYLRRNDVCLNIHGHQHLNSYKKLENGTAVLCVYRCVLIDLENSYIKTIF